MTGTGSLGTVTLDKNGKDVTQQVVVGLRGDSRTQIISGVSAGDQLVITIALPVAELDLDERQLGVGDARRWRARRRRRLRRCAVRLRRWRRRRRFFRRAAGGG